MEVVFSNVLQDLNNFQSKIASLFQDFMKEKVYYQENLEHLCKSLKEASTETEKLKKEIKVLKEDNLNMRSIISKGNSLLKSLDLSKTSKQITNELEALRTIFLDYSTKMENLNMTDTVPSKEIIPSIRRYELSEEEIQKEIESLKAMNFSNIFNDDKTEKNTNKGSVLKRSCSEKAFKSCETVEKEEKVTKESTSVHWTKAYDLDFINTSVCSETVKPVKGFNENNKSPVFKDISGRRNYCNLNAEENSTDSGWESNLINEKFLEKTINSDLSSPQKPQDSTRILTQTFLNVERFRQKTPDSGENDTPKKWKKTSQEEIDETIMETRNKADQVLKENKEISEREVEEIPFMTPLLTEPDLDETYISSSIIRKHVLEGEIEDQTPLKRHALQRSPVKEFLYKDKPVRKKSERMKLPGHACVDCNKYYKNALGDINSQDLKKILNKCSRHRERYSPSLDDTPPDYWKPYLTNSTIIIPNT